MPESSNAPFFIVGAGRSGTTLLRAALAAHSRIAVPPETHYFKFIEEFGAPGADAPHRFDEFWSRLVEGRRFRDLDIDPARVLAVTIERREPLTFRGIFKAMMEVYAQTMGKPRWGEKTPGHSRYLERIFGWFPDAKVVAIRRDPRAVVASHLESPWVTDRLNQGGRAPLVPRLRIYHVAERAMNWTKTYGEYLKDAGSDPRLHLVEYEKLVTDPERELSAVAAFLGETYEPSMVQDRTGVPGSAARETISSAEWRDWVRVHEARAAAPISSNGIEKWRDLLSPRELATVEAICDDHMTRFGYGLETSASQRALSAMMARAARLASDTETNARAGARRVREKLFRDKAAE